MSFWLSLSLPNPFKSRPEDESPSILSQCVASIIGPSDRPPSQTLTGIKKDLAEIGGSFKSTLSLLSTNKMSRFVSNLLEEYEEEAVGISEQVIDFVEEISLHPDLWTDFPLSMHKHNDFDMSDVQKDHVSTIEHLVPSLAALRHKFDSHMSEEQFWIIYFVLLLPRLNDNDSELLSTPEIVEVREALLQKLNSKKHNASVEVSGEHKSRNVAETGTDINSTQKMKHPSSSSKLSSDDLNAPERILTQDHENSKPSSSDEDVNTGTYENTRNKQTENEDDISFIDLEDDDNDLSSIMSGNKVSSPSQSGSSEWVQLKGNPKIRGWLRKDRRSADREKDSGSEDSNDWLTIDKIDSD